MKGSLNLFILNMEMSSELCRSFHHCELMLYSSFNTSLLLWWLCPLYLCPKTLELSSPHIHKYLITWAFSIRRISVFKKKGEKKTFVHYYFYIYILSKFLQPSDAAVTDVFLSVKNITAITLVAIHC